MSLAEGVVAGVKVLRLVGLDFLKNTFYYGKFQTHRKVQRKYNEPLYSSLVSMMNLSTPPSCYFLDNILFCLRIFQCVSKR